MHMDMDMDTDVHTGSTYISVRYRTHRTSTRERNTFTRHDLTAEAAAPTEKQKDKNAGDIVQDL